MFREVRQEKQSLAREDIDSILERGSYGTLALLGDDEYPYSVPISYIYYDGKIYFHSLPAGHKIEAMTAREKISFSLVDEATLVPEEYTFYFRSVIAFGKVRVATETERLEVFHALTAKYSGPVPEADRRAKVDNCKRAQVYAIEIEHITGKTSA
ncbi:MAG: 5-nitroimidazole antibiotic resistance protein [Clostridiaceae bacterium]|jgi:nitroimidazol reductase NimA-like FMN-containing flavoprotein (pyridoxamine 5'-phosphate oxidase superfamily)|nr:5-nitroimidazole antibiotic resistance protein [Clostridiaceae bacterium]